MTKLTQALILVILMVGISIHLPALYKVDHLTNDSSKKGQPEINRVGQVAWVGGATAETDQIYLYDGEKIKSIENLSPGERSINLNNKGQIVWEAYSAIPGVMGYEIFFYDGEKARQITQNKRPDHSPFLNNEGEFVWVGNDGQDNEIFLYKEGKILQLTDNEEDDSNPQINDKGEIVWQGWDGTDYEIYLYEEGSITNLTDNETHEILPQINRVGTIVWVAGMGKQKISIYDKGTLKDLDHPYDSTMAFQINNENKLAWTNKGNLYFYDGRDIQKINSNPLAHPGFHLNDKGELVWLSFENPMNTEIYYYDGSEVTNLSNNQNPEGNVSPKINKESEVVWITRKGINEEVVIAKQSN